MTIISLDENFPISSNFPCITETNSRLFVCFFCCEGTRLSLARPSTTCTLGSLVVVFRQIDDWTRYRVVRGTTTKNPRWPQLPSDKYAVSPVCHVWFRTTVNFTVHQGQCNEMRPAYSIEPLALAGITGKLSSQFVCVCVCESRLQFLSLPLSSVFHTISSVRSRSSLSHGDSMSCTTLILLSRMGCYNCKTQTSSATECSTVCMCVYSGWVCVQGEAVRPDSSLNLPYTTRVSQSPE